MNLPEHCLEIYNSLRHGRMTRAQMRRHFQLGTGRKIPKGVNLREHFATWHAHQQAVNFGLPPSGFWKRCVGA